MWRKLNSFGSLQLSKMLVIDQRTYMKFETGQKLSATIMKSVTKKAKILL
jgi:hypothetical protein